MGRVNDRELVVIKIDAGQDLPFLELGDSDAVKPGQISYVFGDSYDSIRSDDQAAMSLGVISGSRAHPAARQVALHGQGARDVRRSTRRKRRPARRPRGSAAGVVTLNYDDSKFTGLAVPVNALKPAIEKIRKDYSSAPVVIGPLRPEPAAESRKPAEPAPRAEVGHAWLGLEVKAAAGGVEVTRSTRRSPAHGAGIRRGDVLSMIDGTKIASVDAYLAALAKKAPEDTVRLTIQREGGDLQELLVKLTAKPVY